MFLNGSSANSEAAFTEAANRIYSDPNLSIEQRQQMIVQVFFDTGVSMEFAAMTFGIPVSDVQTVIDRYVNTVVFSPPVQAPTQAEIRAAAQAAEAARQAQQAIENAKNSSIPVFGPDFPPDDNIEMAPVKTATTGASPVLLLAAIAASLLLGG